MRVGVEVGGVRAERLDRNDQARRDVVAIEDRANARDDRVAGRAGEQAEQASLALEQPAQDARIFVTTCSANSAERLAWQLGQKLRARQEKASRCSARCSGQRIRAKPPSSRPQAR